MQYALVQLYALNRPLGATPVLGVVWVTIAVHRGHLRMLWRAVGLRFRPWRFAVEREVYLFDSSEL